VGAPPETRGTARFGVSFSWCRVVAGARRGPHRVCPRRLPWTPSASTSSPVPFRLAHRAAACSLRWRVGCSRRCRLPVATLSRPGRNTRKRGRNGRRQALLASRAAPARSAVTMAAADSAACRAQTRGSAKAGSASVHRGGRSAAANAASFAALLVREIRTRANAARPTARAVPVCRTVILAVRTIVRSTSAWDARAAPNARSAPSARAASATIFARIRSRWIERGLASGPHPS
jgi:hypothetical protein